MTIELPTIHLNGTGADALRDAYTLVYNELGDVYRAMKEAAPNGRDYYVKPGSLETATDQHMDRLRRIGALRDEIEAIIGGIEDQIR